MGEITGKHGTISYKVNDEGEVLLTLVESNGPGIWMAVANCLEARPVLLQRRVGDLYPGGAQAKLVFPAPIDPVMMNSVTCAVLECALEVPLHEQCETSIEEALAFAGLRAS